MQSENNRNHMTESEARTAILEYRERTGKSQNATAREIGISSSALSQFISGTYAADTRTIITAIEQLLKISGKREAAPKKRAYKATTTSQQVTFTITLSHVQGELCVVHGDPGVGKTMAIKQYAKENPDAIVITVSSANRTVTGINEMIAEKLKITGKNTRRMTAEIIAKLKGSKRVIIIDEAQHLKQHVVNHLRCIVDGTEDEDTGERVGMVLIGNDEIYHELAVKKAEGHKQTNDRVYHWERVTASNTQLEDTKQIFSDIECEGEALALLHKISVQVSTRKAVQVLNKALIEFQVKNSSEMTAANLAVVAKKMNVRIA